MSAPAVARLVAAASEPYRAAGPFAYRFARGKLAADPGFTALLKLGLLSGRSRVLDLGCGQGLLAAWLLAAQDAYGRGLWPPDWPAPPRPAAIRGIDLMPQEIERARRALGARAEFSVGDLRTSDYGAADAVVVLDVLHYLDASAQLRVLDKVRAALGGGGLLLLRVGDAEGGLRFRAGQLWDQVVLLLRGHGLKPLSFRSARSWHQILDGLGFATQAIPMSAGTPFANVLLVGRLR